MYWPQDMNIPYCSIFYHRADAMIPQALSLSAPSINVSAEANALFWYFQTLFRVHETKFVTPIAIRGYRTSRLREYQANKSMQREVKLEIKPFINLRGQHGISRPKIFHLWYKICHKWDEIKLYNFYYFSIVN